MENLAISPCPNDTFAFYALLHGKTSWGDAPPVRFADIEELNHLCFAGNIHFCKISFHAYLLAKHKYHLLQAGSALGRRCGPLIVAREQLSLERLRDAHIAIPGRFTTAALLLQLWSEGTVHLTEMVFDRIMPAVACGEVDAGLIIHESRFTYQKHGLYALVDLGEWWEETSGHPIPLGGIVARRDLPSARVSAFDKALGESIDYAWRHRDETLSFMRAHAQEMDESVMKAHVDLYVNPFTRALGNEGFQAIEELEKQARALGICT